jgi:hypothetical protein
LPFSSLHVSHERLVEISTMRTVAPGTAVPDAVCTRPLACTPGAEVGACAAEGAEGEEPDGADGDEGEVDGVDGEDDGEFGLCAACACAASPNENVSAHSIAQHAIQTRRGVRDTSVRSFNFRSTEPSPLPVVSAGAEAAGTHRLESLLSPPACEA